MVAFRNGMGAFFQGKEAVSGSLWSCDEFDLAQPSTPSLPSTQTCGKDPPQESRGDFLECRFQRAELYFSPLNIFSFTFSKDQRSGLFHLQDNKNKVAVNFTKHVLILVQ